MQINLGVISVTFLALVSPGLTILSLESMFMVMNYHNFREDVLQGYQAALKCPLCKFQCFEGQDMKFISALFTQFWMI